MKKILVTGSNGLLGQKLVHALSGRKDVQLIATSSGTNRILKKEGYTYESLDITDRTEVEAVLTKYHPDVVINTAAMTNVDACETAKEACWALNVTAVQHLVEVLEKINQATHFIQLSTDFIFDGNKGSEYLETDQPNPQSYFALSKYESEKIVFLCLFFFVFFC